MHARKKAAAPNANEIRTTLLPRLTALGVARIKADYSGYQGAGGIDMLDFIDEAGAPIDVEQADPPLIHRVRDVLAAFLPEGFEQSEGGQGDLWLEVATGTVRLEHEENYTANRTTSREWRI